MLSLEGKPLSWALCKLWYHHRYIDLPLLTYCYTSTTPSTTDSPIVARLDPLLVYSHGLALRKQEFLAWRIFLALSAAFYILFSFMVNHWYKNPILDIDIIWQDATL